MPRVLSVWCKAEKYVTVSAIHCCIAMLMGRLTEMSAAYVPARSLTAAALWQSLKQYVLRMPLRNQKKVPIFSEATECPDISASMQLVHFWHFVHVGVAIIVRCMY